MSDRIKSRLLKDYQSAQRVLMIVERKQIETPSSAQAREIFEFQGYLRGLKSAIDYLEEDLNQEFPGFGNLEPKRPE